MTGLTLAFAAGLLSILSPCVLPLVPIVLGAAVTAHPLGASALAAGLALSFTALGLLLALVGFSLGIDAGMFRLAAAAIMVVLGAVLLVPSWQARLAAAGGPVSGWADRRFGSSLASSGLAGQFAIGLLLGAVWSPCVGPTLGAASLLASQGHDLARVTLTMAVFGVGAALPLVLLGLLSRATLMRVRASLMSAGKFGKGLLGASFIVIGFLIVSGADKRVEAALVDASPQWLTDLTTSF
ncbi:MAG: cytochrome c biogenesis protein CcdA [Bradyrhizobium sp.]